MNELTNKGVTRRTFMKGMGGAALGAGAAVVGVPRNARAAPTRTVTLTPTTLHATVGEHIQQFVNDVALLSGGKLTFDIVEADFSPDRFTEVSAGAVEAAANIPFLRPGKPSGWLFTGALPFGFEPHEHLEWMYEGGGLTLENDIYEPDGVVALPLVSLSSELAGYFIAPIPSKPKQFNATGWTVRILNPGFNPSLAAQLVKRTFEGITVTSSQPAAFEGLIEAIAAGALQGMEFGSPAWDKVDLFEARIASGLQTVVEAGAPHLHVGAWHQPALMHELQINQTVWETTLAPYQDVIRHAAYKTSWESLARNAVADAQALKFLVDSGAILTSWPEQVLAELRNNAIGLLNEIAGGDAEFADVLDSLRQFAKQQQHWYANASTPREDRFSWGDWESLV